MLPYKIKHSSKKWWIFSLLLLSLSLSSLDWVLMPLILQGVQLTFLLPPLFLWHIVGIYSLFIAFFLWFVSPFVIHRWRDKSAFLIGLAFFFLGAFFAGAAPSCLFFLSGKIVQAMGSALLLPSSLRLLFFFFEEPLRRKIASLSLMISSLWLLLIPLGATLSCSMLSWRYVFCFEGLLCLLSGYLMKVLLPSSSSFDVAHFSSARIFQGGKNQLFLRASLLLFLAHALLIQMLFTSFFYIGRSTLEIGLIQALSAFPLIVISPFLLSWIERMGVKKTLFIGSSLLILSLFFLFFLGFYTQMNCQSLTVGFSLFWLSTALLQLGVSRLGVRNVESQDTAKVSVKISFFCYTGGAYGAFVGTLCLDMQALQRIIGVEIFLLLAIVCSLSLLRKKESVKTLPQSSLS